MTCKPKECAFKWHDTKMGYHCFICGDLLQVHENETIAPCIEDQDMLRLHPKSVCRSLLANCESLKPLNSDEQAEVLAALKFARVDTDRILAHYSRTAINQVLNEL